MPPENDQSRYPEKLGGMMTLMAWVLFIAVLTLLFSAWLDRQTNPNLHVSSRTDGGAIEIILDRNRSGHYVATASLNGVVSKAMIDTGATDVSVPAGIAARAGLQPGPVIEVGTANGTIPVQSTIIDTVQLGDLILHNVRANINPAIEEDIVLLGMSFLKRVEFSQRQGQLILRQTETR